MMLIKGIWGIRSNSSNEQDYGCDKQFDKWLWTSRSTDLTRTGHLADFPNGVRRATAVLHTALEGLVVYDRNWAHTEQQIGLTMSWINRLWCGAGHTIVRWTEAVGISDQGTELTRN